MRGHVSALARDFAFGTAQVALKIVLLADTAWMMGDAIVRTLYRLYGSRRHLLEWRTASQAGQVPATDIVAGHYRMMYGAVVIGARRPAAAAPGRLDRRLRRADLLAVLDRLAGLRLAGQPLGRDRGPAG